MTRGWTPSTRYTLGRNIASAMKGLIWFDKFADSFVNLHSPVLLTNIEGGVSYG